MSAYLSNAVPPVGREEFVKLLREKCLELEAQEPQLYSMRARLLNDFRQSIDAHAGATLNEMRQLAARNVSRAARATRIAWVASILPAVVLSVAGVVGGLTGALTATVGTILVISGACAISLTSLVEPYALRESQARKFAEDLEKWSGQLLPDVRAADLQPSSAA